MITKIVEVVIMVVTDLIIIVEAEEEGPNASYALKKIV